MSMSIPPPPQYPFYSLLARSWVRFYTPLKTPQRIAPRATFHTSQSLHDDIPSNPYEILGVSPSASQAEIKQQFFQLSKIHHPDRNPKDQEAAARKFVAISDAYRIVGDQAKREQFDREQQKSSGYKAAPESRGSYAGGRAPSGLSRRRTAFRGPPPSFYRNGGWGSNTRKGPENTATGAGAEETGRQEQQSTTGPYGGTVGSWPFKTDPNDVPHFNREGHYRTTTSIEEQLKRGRAGRRQFDQMLDDDSPGHVAGRFLMVLGMLTIGIGTPLMLFGGKFTS